MASPLSVKKNNYIDNPKKSDIATPPWLAQWLHDIVKESGIKTDVILDPAIGDGVLTKSFAKDGNSIIGIDIIDNNSEANVFMQTAFQDIESWENIKTPDFIICNPPFNQASGRKLYPEVFLKQIDKLFGSKMPVMMFVPMGLRLNQRCKSSRWKYLRDNWDITSIIALPIDVFDNVLFHVEIVCFNMPQLKSSYFMPDSIIPLEKFIKQNG